MSALVDLIRKQCRGKLGMTKSPLSEEEYQILNGSLSGFARLVLDETPPVVLLRCRDAVRERLQAISKGVCVSERMQWETEGWTWTDVPLDDAIPESEWLPLLDDSYELACEDLYDFQKKHLALLRKKLTPAELFTELLNSKGLSRQREKIEGLSRPAVLLKTKKAVESKLALGQSKIGGKPDLPEDIEWPQFQGKPLAFLAQINLSEVAAAGRLQGLPMSGLLCFFSVFGWQVEGDADPQLPPGKYHQDWTRVLYFAEGQTVWRQRRTPAGVNSFKAARIEFVPFVCFPTHAKEPALAALGWSRGVKDKYEDFVSAYKGARDFDLGNPTRNLLLGYADYEQEFVKEVAEEDLQLLFQLGSDDNSEMCWGDGGFIYFWIGKKDLSRQRFEKVLTDYQCG